MLTMLCLPSLADLIALSQFLPLEAPSFFYSHERFTKQSLIKCQPCCVFPQWLIWPYWVYVSRWKLRLPYIYITFWYGNLQKAWQNQQCENTYLAYSSFAGCFIVLSGFLPLTTPPSISPIHMAIIRRLDSTAQKLTLPCLPSLADLIVLSGILSLETLSSLYITYSYGYHEKALQSQHC